MKVLLAGGGTGGHINPALAIASIIKKHDPSAEFLFVGTPNGMEARLVPAAGYPMETMHVAGFQRKLTLKNIRRNCKAVYYLATSQHRAKQILKQFQPDIAIGTGGYVAGPILHAAARMGIPCAIHEQNAFPGVTNKMLAKEVDHVMLTVEKALEFFHLNCPYTVTGLPVRGGISGMDRAAARKQLGFDDGMCILSFGGSLGAGCINEAMAKVIPWHVQKGCQLHQHKITHASLCLRVNQAHHASIARTRRMAAEQMRCAHRSHYCRHDGPKNKWPKDDECPACSESNAVLYSLLGS